MLQLNFRNGESSNHSPVFRIGVSCNLSHYRISHYNVPLS